MLRRSFMRLVSGVLLGAWSAVGAGAGGSAYRFEHGVSSGDPLADRVILWTRVSGATGESVRVSWIVARDATLSDVVAAGEVSTDAERDYTVKVDAAGLPAGASLYYAFNAGEAQSPLGRTRTLPVGQVSGARFAVVTCSNHPAGFFNVYRDIASRDDLDAVIHLGDYIYEYEMGGYATALAERLGRVPEPLHETVSLADYRRRHAQYKADPDSRTMHARHPLIAVWDDHEIANDAWTGGAENHDDAEGSWKRRRDAATQAYFEWMPVREAHDGDRARLYRDFDYGGLLRLVLLDTRHYGRDRLPDLSESDGSRQGIMAVIDSGKRQMLGRRQERWLRKRLRTAGTTWQIIGQQVLVSPFLTPDLEPLLDLQRDAYLSGDELRELIARSKLHAPALTDTWDGYPWARERFLAELDRFAANPVVLSGDLHTPTAGDLYRQDGDAPVAVEFMPSSVSSPGFSDYLPEQEPGVLAEATIARNPHLRYMGTGRRGWLCLTVNAEECLAEWHHVDTVFSPEYRSAVDRRLKVRAGHVDEGLQEA